MAALRVGSRMLPIRGERRPPPLVLDGGRFRRVEDKLGGFRVALPGSKSRNGGALATMCRVCVCVCVCLKVGGRGILGAVLPRDQSALPWTATTTMVSKPTDVHVTLHKRARRLSDE